MAYSEDLAARVEHERPWPGRFRTRIATLAVRLGRARPRRRRRGPQSEHGAPDAFTTYFAALFWTTTQLLTVSSPLPNPERALTKVLDVVLEA